jgi:hypothetical protein
MKELLLSLSLYFLVACIGFFVQGVTDGPIIDVFKYHNFWLFMCASVALVQGAVAKALTKKHFKILCGVFFLLFSIGFTLTLN